MLFRNLKRAHLPSVANVPQGRTPLGSYAMPGHINSLRTLYVVDASQAAITEE